MEAAIAIFNLARSSRLSRSALFLSADFLDTRIDTVVHKKTVWDARTLAQVIPARAELLLSTERNF